MIAKGDVTGADNKSYQRHVSKASQKHVIAAHDMYDTWKCTTHESNLPLTARVGPPSCTGAPWS